jgi:phage FluMu protein Com
MATKEKTESLLKRHNRHLCAHVGKGGNWQPLKCPECSVVTHVIAPREENQTWDSLMQCPHCDELFWHWATKFGASASKIPTGE